MSLVDQLEEDFDIFLEDWGEDVVITHITAEALNVETGEYVAVTTDTGVEAIINPITKQEISVNPNYFKTTDITVYYKKEDFAGIDITDAITYNSLEYKILTIIEMKKIYKLICRK